VDSRPRAETLPLGVRGIKCIPRFVFSHNVGAKQPKSCHGFSGIDPVSKPWMSRIAGVNNVALWQNLWVKMALSSSRQASPLRGGDRRRRELEARKPSPPLACLLLESLSASGGEWWVNVEGALDAAIC
jgi:hypothetical protein